MDAQNIEAYSHRAVENLGIWEIGLVNLKAYAIIANGHELSSGVIDEARAFVSNHVPELVAREGKSNGLGFVIIHLGDLGLTISAH